MWHAQFTFEIVHEVVVYVWSRRFVISTNNMKPRNVRVHQMGLCVSAQSAAASALLHYNRVHCIPRAHRVVSRIYITTVRLNTGRDREAIKLLLFPALVSRPVSITLLCLFTFK